MTEQEEHSMCHKRPRPQPLASFLAVALLSATCQAEPPRVVVEATLELRASGNNYDDPCFWQDRADPQRAVACITSKGRRQVECFDLASGASLPEVARGFEGEANNCDVDVARNELATTDTGAEAVRIHELPSLRLLRSLPVRGADDLAGICVAHDGGRSMLFVTDEDTPRVVALDSSSGEILHEWNHGMSQVEGIACDDDWRRVIVCDEGSDDHSCRAFGYDGQPGPEFGAEVLGKEAEGVSIYRCPERHGYVIVSDQEHSEFEVFDRGDFGHVCTFATKKGSDLTHDTEGIDVLQSSASPEGLFGACDGCRPGSGDELHVTPWSAIAKACGLRVCPVPGALE
jgi:myo-inositol-hexaphosphate 3-phosphohydrolase